MGFEKRMSNGEGETQLGADADAQHAAVDEYDRRLLRGPIEDRLHASDREASSACIAGNRQAACNVARSPRALPGAGIHHREREESIGMRARGGGD